MIIYRFALVVAVKVMGPSSNRFSTYIAFSLVFVHLFFLVNINNYLFPVYF